MSNKKLSGEVYFPLEKVIENSNIKDRDDLDNRAKKDYSGSARVVVSPS